MSKRSKEQSEQKPLVKPVRSPKRGKSLGRRMAEQERQLTDRMAEKRKARRAARDVYAAIGFDLMYENGIAQVEEGLFSQTLSFDDISYQSAREENQQAIFSGWCQLFDYFGAESCVQLSIVNRPIPADLIGRKRFFSEEDLDTAAYAAEYNRILNEKMREGVSNLTRERYLTFSVGAASIDEAVPKLARMRTDAEQTLAKMRSAARPLTGEERLDAIHGLLRPGKPNLFSWDAVGAASGLTSKDLVCPASVVALAEGVRIYHLDAERFQPRRLLLGRRAGPCLAADRLAVPVALLGEHGHHVVLGEHVVVFAHERHGLEVQVHGVHRYDLRAPHVGLGLVLGDVGTDGGVRDRDPQREHRLDAAPALGLGELLAVVVLRVEDLRDPGVVPSVHHVLALPQNQPNAPLYPAGGAPGSRPGALPHFGRPRYLGPPPRARSTAG